MSEQEKKSGIGAAGIVGGAAAGVGGGVLLNNRISQTAVVNALADNDKATKKFSEAVGDIFKKKPGLANMDNGISLLGESAESLTKVKFKGKEGAFRAILTDGAESGIIKGIKKLPEGVQVGQVLDKAGIQKLTEGGDKSAAAQILKAGDQHLAKGIRKAGGLGFGFKNMGNGGKAAVVGATLACAAAGAMVAHQLFGGKHTDKAAAEQRSAAVGRT